VCTPLSEKENRFGKCKAAALCKTVQRTGKTVVDSLVSFDEVRQISRLRVTWCHVVSRGTQILALPGKRDRENDASFDRFPPCFAFVLAKCTFGGRLQKCRYSSLFDFGSLFACTQSTMDSENVHPQRQPTLRPSLGKAQIEMRRVETTGQLLRKGDSASLLNHFRTGSTHPADGAARTSKPALPRRKINKAGLAFLAGTSTGTANKIPHDVFASIAGHTDQTCENSPAAGAPTVASFSYMGMGDRATTALARGPLASSLTGARKGAAALCICEEEEEKQQQQEAPAVEQARTPLPFVQTWITEERM